MPRKPEWIQQLEAITEQLKTTSGSFPGELLDRSAVEQIFQVKPRQATRILHKMGARTVGGALLITQSEMLAALGTLSQGQEVQTEQRRRRSLIEKLEQARRESRGRHTVIPAPESPGEFPPGTEVKAGKLEIHFQDPVELLQKMMQLAQLASEDWNVFVERIR
jgi:hypothetical protein